MWGEKTVRVCTCRISEFAKSPELFSSVQLLRWLRHGVSRTAQVRPSMVPCQVSGARLLDERRRSQGRLQAPTPHARAPTTCPSAIPCARTRPCTLLRRCSLSRVPQAAPASPRARLARPTRCRSGVLPQLSRLQPTPGDQRPHDARDVARQQPTLPQPVWRGRRLPRPAGRAGQRQRRLRPDLLDRVLVARPRPRAAQRHLEADLACVPRQRRTAGGDPHAELQAGRHQLGRRRQGQSRTQT